MNRTIPRAAAAVTTATAVVLLAAAPSGAQPPDPLPDSLAHLALPDDVGTAAAEPESTLVEPALLAATGPVTVSLELSDPSLAEAVGEGARQHGSALSAAAQRSHVAALRAAQRELLDRIAGLGATEVTTTQLANNTVVVEVDAGQVPALAATPGVDKVLQVTDFALDLSETVPHIGAARLHDEVGLTGDGVRVAVLDSGLDYTHAAFGGEGTLDAYHTAYGTAADDPANTTRDGLFPTGRVVEGFDFVGESWPEGDLAPDPDPIDCGPDAIPDTCDLGAAGHGTTVAAILAGERGVAPGADLLSYKVCSTIVNSCSGVALLEAMEAALDPNGDGDIEDAVDVINMSLGRNYGLVENPLSGASANAVRMGVTVVASAGNSGDRPFVTGSASSTPEVIGVAWTELPSAEALVLTVHEPGGIAGDYANTNRVPWAPVTDGFSGELGYGSTGTEQLGCFLDDEGEPTRDDTGVSPFPPGFFEGQVALMDRGLCAISHKVSNAAAAGAIGVVVANNVAGAAPSFAFGPVDPFHEQQTLIVGLEVGNALRDGLATGAPVVVEVDPAVGIPLINSMNAASSRGPSLSEVAIKPDIGAPGASTAAEAGTGTGTRVFGGTSGAAPMVAGSAALLLQAYPDRTPLEIKAALMNTAETEIFIHPGQRPGELAEISRIGGGEVRVDAAHASGTAAWSGEDQSAGLSFGYHSLDRPTVLRKEVTVRNYSDQRQVYRVEPTFRHEDDAASGAVRFIMPPRVAVGPGGTRTVPVTMVIDPRQLPQWVLDGGPNGGNGPLLRENELDGYLVLTGGGDRVTLPWHVLPHRASDVRAPDGVTLRRGTATANLVNSTASGQAGTGEVFALTGTSPELPPDQVPGEGDGFAAVDLSAVGVRTVDDAFLQFGITTHRPRTHPAAPAEFQVDIDADRDGTPDVRVFNRDLSLGVTPSDGSNVVWTLDLHDPEAQPVPQFFADTNLVSANAILTVPLAEVGLAPGSQFDFVVSGVDFYFTGAVTDTIGTMTVTAGQPRYATAGTVEVPAPGVRRLTITEVDGGAEASPSQSGVLVLWRDGMTGQEAAAIAVR